MQVHLTFGTALWYESFLGRTSVFPASWSDRNARSQRLPQRPRMATPASTSSNQIPVDFCLFVPGNFYDWDGDAQRSAVEGGMVNLENEISTRSKHRTHSTSATEHRGTLLGMQPHHRADLYICTCTHRFAITHSQPHRRYGSHRPRYAHSRCSGGSAMRQHVLSRRIGTFRRRPRVAQRWQQCTCTPAQNTGMCAVARRRGHGRERGRDATRHNTTRPEARRGEARRDEAR